MREKESLFFAVVDQMSATAMFNGSLYSLDPLGTDKTLSGFTADSVKNYYQQKLLNKNRMFLVVAGNITKEELEKKVLAAFGTIQAKPYRPVVYEQGVLQGERLLTVDDLGEAEVPGGYELQENKIATIDKVRLVDIQLALNKYLKGAIWIYLGDEELGKSVFK